MRPATAPTDHGRSGGLHARPPRARLPSMRCGGERQAPGSETRPGPLVLPRDVDAQDAGRRAPARQRRLLRLIAAGACRRSRTVAARRFVPWRDLP